MKIKSLLIIILLLSPMVLSVPCGLADDVVWEVENLNDMIGFISSIEILQSHSAGGQVGQNVFSYTVIGDETVESTPCSKLNFTIGEPGELDNYTLWISKSTGLAVQVLFDGTIQTGPMAEYLGSAVLMLFNVLTVTWAAYSYEAIYTWEDSTYGSVSNLGTESRQIGPTTLTLNGIRYSGSDPTGQSHVTVDVWYAPTQNGHIMIDFEVETVFEGQSSLQEMKVVSITLSEDQIIPVDPDDPTGDNSTGDDTTGDDTTGDDTTGDDTTGDDTNTTGDDQTNEEQNQSGGGIPGFPYEAIISGLAVVVLLYYMRKH